MLQIGDNAAEVKISTSLTGGVGLIDAKARACGVPVIAQDFSSPSPVVGSRWYLGQTPKTFYHGSNGNF